MLATPWPASLPPLPSELRQPEPAPTGLLLPHGHAVPLPSPKQNGVPVDPLPQVACRSSTQLCGAPWITTESNVAGGTLLACRLLRSNVPVAWPAIHAT